MLDKHRSIKQMATYTGVFLLVTICAFLFVKMLGDIQIPHGADYDQGKMDKAILKSAKLMVRGE
jgi:hypothetical protein